ncbi:hypothetical protein [Herbiconiux daphne]|uniref:Uncharacterized protein n=1 Tax=Herbiconiux daphne TaxID=2970914 RepID=A0ABT2HAX2_9MICO|nr:hypothetical protein [Herbiconiux daphne]MCS5737090.1 hypothetical protein [Herbiconiux daphne]
MTIKQRVSFTLLAFVAITGLGTGITSTYKAENLKDQIKITQEAKEKSEKDLNHKISIIQDRLDKTQADTQVAKENVNALQKDNIKQNKDIVELKK